MKQPIEKTQARERILKAAADLFYRQGYRATGINEVIKEADVAKATFYAHFPSKDDLCHAYLEEQHQAELAEVKAFIYRHNAPADRLLAMVDVVELAMVQDLFRGCRYLLIAAEVPDVASPIRQVGMSHYEGLRHLLCSLAEELKTSDPETYAHIEPQRLADTVLLAITGAMGLYVLYQDIWAFRQAKAVIQQILQAG